MRSGTKLIPVATLAALGALAAVAAFVHWRAAGRAEYLKRVVRERKSERETLAAVEELLTVYERRGQLGRITQDTLSQWLGLPATQASEIPPLPLPFLDAPPAYRTFAFDFPGIRKVLRLSFDAKTGELREWWIKEVIESGEQTIY